MDPPVSAISAAQCAHAARPARVCASPCTPLCCSRPLCTPQEGAREAIAIGDVAGGPARGAAAFAGADIGAQRALAIAALAALCFSCAPRSAKAPARLRAAAAPVSMRVPSACTSPETRFLRTPLLHAPELSHPGLVPSLF